MISHKFIDVLRGVSNEAQLYLVSNTSLKSAQTFAELINDAEKFDFGDIYLESDGDNTWLLPQLTDDEWEAFAEGLIPMPAPVCWYEFTVEGSRFGILIRDDWVCTRLDWGKKLIFDNHKTWIVKSTIGYNVRIDIEGPEKSVTDPEVQDAYISAPQFVVYLTLMLNSRSTEIVRSDPPVKLNRARAKRGRAELASHRIVRIVPKTYLRERREENGLTRLPPRLHYRRSHIRTLHRGESGERKIIIPRFLVGRASDAEVSHEYRIVNTEKDNG